VVLVFSKSTDVLLGQSCFHNKLVGIIPAHMWDDEQGFTQLFLEMAQGKLVVSIVNTTSNQEDLEHGEHQVVLILTSLHQLKSVVAKVNRKELDVFSRVVPGLATLDSGAEVLESFDGGGLH
jgi:hypothetical protein